MFRLLPTLGLLLVSSFSVVGQQQAARRDPVYQRLKATLDRVKAIDMHAHLFEKRAFDPNLADVGPLMIRSTNPFLPAVVRERFGVSVRADNWQKTYEAINAARASLVKRLGDHGYWLNHLDYALTDIALINQGSREGTDGLRLRWVPYGSTLLFPLRADHLMERSPAHQSTIPEVQTELRGFLKEAQLSEPPPTLAAYVRFIDDTLRRWKTQGAVGVKFWDAYLRTLRIADVPETQASSLYETGRTTALSREDYLAVQDYLWRHIMLEAGKLNIPVHIHSSFGEPPFLRTYESDVRNLDDVLTDPQFFNTQIVLIHGGGPWYETAAYLAMKPNVWLDISSIGFLYPVPEFAGILRAFLRFAPEKVLYGTDAANYSMLVGGADVQHVMLARANREALYLALSGLVRDGLIDEKRAVEMGRGVLRENAKRLNGWQ